MSNIIKQAEYYAFVEWSARPRMYREPGTQIELAERLGVDKDTLSRWRKDPNYNEDVRRATTLWAKDLIPEIIASLHSKAMFGDTKAIEIFLTHFDEYKVKNEDTKVLEIGTNLRDVLMSRYKARQLEARENGSTTTKQPTKH